MVFFFCTCGNGLLTHILVSEGYEGYGIDLRARSSWEGYSEETQDRLKVVAIDPTIVPSSSTSHSNDSMSPDQLNVLQTYLPKDSWIISNHADELTPWTPLLAVLYGCTGYISIPCCPWSFDAKFDRAQVGEFLSSASSKDVEEDVEESASKMEDEQREKEEERRS
ncbi:hypothetical protein BDQ17DRAFT_1438512 [Cyathus striatus]|nr:hypothetical protein BDQ17DRAFT_1438512 [Cyathus striatus]